MLSPVGVADCRANTFGVAFLQSKAMVTIPAALTVLFGVSLFAVYVLFLLHAAIHTVFATLNSLFLAYCFNLVMYL